MSLHTICAILIIQIYCLVSFTEPRICSGPPETGLCRAAIPKWFYNTTALECQQFIYGGCGGNDNRHDSQEECEATCLRTRTFVALGGGRSLKPRSVRPPRTRPAAAKSTATFTHGRVAVIAGSNATLACKLNGTNPISWVFYPPNSEQEVYLFDSGIQRSNITERYSKVANHSRGESNLIIYDIQSSDAGRYECLESDAISKGILFQLDVYPVASSEACNSERGPVTGKCRAWISKWFYNATAAECQRFVYGGCGANDNNYLSRPQCERTCLGRPLQASASGNNSNHNNSSRSSERNRPRSSRSTTPLTTAVEVIPLNDQPVINSYNRPECSGPAVVGRCRGAIQKWFYNEAESKCQSFIYGGCGGNENRHDSKEQCERSCLKQRTH